MQIRLCPDLGGDGTRHGIHVVNDTGSDILSIFYADLQQLGNYQHYRGFLADALIGTANGSVERLHSLTVEVQFVASGTYVPWGSWFREQAVLRHLVPGVDRLSGLGMRNVYYFGTPPGNRHVAVSTSKTGLTSIL